MQWKRDNARFFVSIYNIVHVQVLQSSDAGSITVPVKHEEANLMLEKTTLAVAKKKLKLGAKSPLNTYR